jgi:hypothetical protein
MNREVFSHQIHAKARCHTSLSTRLPVISIDKIPHPLLGRVLPASMCSCQLFVSYHDSSRKKGKAVRANTFHSRDCPLAYQQGHAKTPWL